MLFNLVIRHGFIVYTDRKHKRLKTAYVFVVHSGTHLLQHYAALPIEQPGQHAEQRSSLSLLMRTLNGFEMESFQTHCKVLRLALLKATREGRDCTTSDSFRVFPFSNSSRFSNLLSVLDAKG